MKKLLFLIITMLTLSYGGKCYASVYYVSTTGSDANPGTSGSPWQHIYKATATLTAGDTVYISAGNYGEWPITSISGTAGNYITYQGVGSPQILGFDIFSKYIKVDGFDVSNSSNYPTCALSGTYVGGIQLSGANYAIVTNNYIHDIPGAPGIFGYFSPTSTGVYVANNLVYHCQTALWIYGANWIVEKNEFNHMYAFCDSHGSQDVDYVRFFGHDHLIDNNYMHGNVASELLPSGAHVDCFQGFDYPPVNISYNIMISSNVCLDAADGFIMQATQNNDASHDITLWGNVFARALDFGVAATFNSQDYPRCNIIHNTLFMGNGNPVVIATYTYHTGFSSPTVRDNIFSGYGTYEASVYSDNSFYQDYNLFINAAGGNNNDHSGAHDINSSGYNHDPLFVSSMNVVGADGIIWTADDGLQLQAGSPAKGKASDGGDMGAYNYGTLPSPSPSPQLTKVCPCIKR